MVDVSPSPSAASGLRAVRGRRHSGRRQSPFPPRAAQDPLAAASAAATPRPDVTIRDGRPFERRRSTGRQERRTRPDRRVAGTYASALERPAGRETAPPSRPAARARRPPALSCSRPGARRGLGACAASPLAATAGPAPGAERLAATRPHHKPRHRLDPQQQHAAAPPHTLTEPRRQNLSNPHRRPQPATPARRFYYLSPALAPAASPRLTSTVHPLDSPNSSTTHPIRLPCTRCRRPASGPSSIPPGLAHPGLPGRSRKGGPARSGGPPILASPGAKRKTGRGRGGGLLRSGKKPIERNRWSETQGGKQAGTATTHVMDSVWHPPNTDARKRRAIVLNS